jgi:hypothetical protein
LVGFHPGSGILIRRLPVAGGGDIFARPESSITLWQKATWSDMDELPAGDNITATDTFRVDQ